MHRGRMLLVLANLALIAAWLGKLHGPTGTWSDGH